MRPHTLRFRVGVWLAASLTAALVVFALLVVRYQREQLLEAAVEHVTQLSEVVTRSTRFAMLQNQPNYVYTIIQDVGNQEHIEKIRIMSKEGRIIHSSYPLEIGTMVDRKADACVHCHESEKPLEQIPRSKRSRIYDAPGGGRLLGSMEVIRNEPACYNAACHAHTKAQSVLGVLDIVYSLDGIDRSMRTNTFAIAAFSAGFIALASLLISFLVHRLVFVPLRDLEGGARRVSGGNLEQPLPVRHDDELGRLAASFNAMTVALKQSHQQLRDWGRTLEQKVEEKTGQLRVAEAEAAQGEKLASVGLLAAGIAHELNNPLTGVLTFSHLLRKKFPDGSPEAEDLDLVIAETRRCATIIRRLLDFAREKKPERKLADLNTVIEETARLVERPAHLSNIEIVMDLDPALPQAWIDDNLIKQVIMNILVNAQHAIEAGGTITVRSRRCPHPFSPEPGTPAVPMVEIAIIDTGCGIPEKNLKRIFDPFFTSKAVGKGTGLGLSVSHGIVTAHGGAIRVESTPGTGSTFRIYLPLEAEQAVHGVSAQ